MADGGQAQMTLAEESGKAVFSEGGKWQVEGKRK